MQASQLRPRRADGGAGQPAGAAHAALAWVVAFFAGRLIFSLLARRYRTRPVARSAARA